MAPAEVTEVELSLADFERFRENWRFAMPEERFDIWSSMVERVYADMGTGQVLEVVPRSGFRAVLEGAGLTKPPSTDLGDFPLVNGDPEGIRTPDLHRDRVAC